MSESKQKFPYPTSHSELKALDGSKKRYEDARFNKRAAASLALLALLAIGTDKLTDGDIGPVSLVASGTVGAATSSALRERKRQQDALKEARMVVSPSSNHADDSIEK